MKAALRPRYVIQQYLEIEAASVNVRHEYVAGEIFAMAGGSPEHAALSGAMGVLLGAHLRGGPCRTYSSDLQISIREAEVFTYADLSVVCDPVLRDVDSPSHVRNPVLVVEVLSPSTERYDREQKRLYYQQLESLREYVLVAQDRVWVEVWRRDGDTWAHAAYGRGEEARLLSVDYLLSVDELYETAGCSARRSTLE